MPLVDTTTGEIVAPLDEAGARDLTDRIRSTAEELWSLLLEAHDRQAWKALGYSSWSAYIDAEFDINRRRSYQLLEQGRVIRAIEDASGVHHGAQITEREARDLKPHLEQVTDRVRRETTAARTTTPDVAPEKVAEITRRVVREERDRIVQKREDTEALRQFDDDARAVFGEPEPTEVVVSKYALFDAITLLADLDPHDIAGRIKPNQAHYLDRVDDAAAHLHALSAAWKERHVRSA